MMQLIKDWLNGPRNYEAGVSLYNQYGDDKQVKRLFEEYRTPFKEKKLVEVLKGLLNKSSKAADVKEKKVAELKKETGTRHGWPLTMTSELMALYNDWQIKFKEAENLNARLYDVAKLGRHDKHKEEEAGQMAHRILRLRSEIKEQYRQRDYYLQHGAFPGLEQPFKPITDPVKIAERRLTVRRYLTRLAKELKKDSKPHIRLKQEKQWTAYVAEMNYINEKLNRPNGEGIPARANQVDDE